MEGWYSIEDFVEEVEKSFLEQVLSLVLFDLHGKSGTGYAAAKVVSEELDDIEIMRLDMTKEMANTSLQMLTDLHEMIGILRESIRKLIELDESNEV